jgi:alanine dehydrogenase
LLVAAVTHDDVSPRWITEREVVDALSLDDAIVALEQGLVHESKGDASSLGKTHAIWGDGHTLHALGATFQGANLVGTKTWAHTAGGATPLLILWHSGTGQLLAVIEAFALGQLRTAGLSGVATRWLADPAADSLALVGAGAQALPQAAACCAVRGLRMVVVFSRTMERARALADKLEAVLDIPVRATTSVRDAVDGASIVTTVTRSREPLLFADMLAVGAHVNAVGAITPDRRELDVEVVERASVIASDNVDAARRLSTDLMSVLGDDSNLWERVRPLSRIVAAAEVPDAHGAFTLYKAMGSGIADVALGHAVLNAISPDAGRPIELPVRVPPRLFASASAKVVSS